MSAINVEIIGYICTVVGLKDSRPDLSLLLSPPSSPPAADNKPRSAGGLAMFSREQVMPLQRKLKVYFPFKSR